MVRVPPPLDALVEGVQRGDRGSLARAITLIESTREEDRVLSDELLTRLLPHVTPSRRLGITGLPGAGKSTLIETLGMQRVAAGDRVAVLSIDPSSRRTGGSLLGDKSRMSRLSQEPTAFIRPSPSGATLGGLARCTRDTITLCEAAGFNLVIVETVGVGQSEVDVAGLVDALLLLLVPGAGDEIQGMKKGVLEWADVVAVTKADGVTEALARSTASDYSSALHLVPPRSGGWTPRVLCISSVSGEGIERLWTTLEEQREHLECAGRREALHADQRGLAFEQALTHELERLRHTDRELASLADAAADTVRRGQRPPTAAARQAVRRWLEEPPHGR